MDIRLLQTEQELQQYQQWFSTHPDRNLWQSLEWKTYQEGLGREVRVYAGFEDSEIVCSALVVVDRTRGGWSTWDIPRGPIEGVGRRASGVAFMIQSLVSEAKNNKAYSMFLSPRTSLRPTPYARRPSSRNEQPTATRILDLTLSPDNLLAQMKQKGRYNIKVARKHGVEVRESKDIDAFYELVKETGKRDGFGILPKSHYQAFLENLEGSFLLLAYGSQETSHPCTRQDRYRARWAVSTADTEAGANAKPIAGLLGVVSGHTGIYYYGASSYAHRALMAPYLLQWEAVEYCRKKGCSEYDLLGISAEKYQDPTKKVQRSSKIQLSSSKDPWSGVSAYKEKFGGEIREYPEEQEIIVNSFVRLGLNIKRRVFG